MFNFISWQSFLTLTTLLVAGYYSITSLMLYRKEIADWVKSLSHPSIPSPSTEPELKEPTENLMGIAQALPESYAIRSSEISAEDIITSGKDEEPETIHSAGKDQLLIGTVADLLEEIKTLIQLIAEYRTGKSESEALFNALFIRYPHLQHTSYPLAISFYICDASKEQFAFGLSCDEVMSWWNLTAQSANK